jgi:hypothetical protein
MKLKRKYITLPHRTIGEPERLEKSFFKRNTQKQHGRCRSSLPAEARSRSKLKGVEANADDSIMQFYNTR